MKKEFSILDLFCCGGGASFGLSNAGFRVVGVDNKPQKKYPFEFILADALTVDLSGFNSYWSSPPCQFASEATPPQLRANHPNLIPQTRERLLATGRPFVIENVENARRHLRNPIMLCGSMFGLNIWRHRYFESNVDLSHSMKCSHKPNPVLISGNSRRLDASGHRIRVHHTAAERRAAIGIDWLDRDTLKQAIPPAFSEFIGKRILQHLRENL